MPWIPLGAVILLGSAVAGFLSLPVAEGRQLAAAMASLGRWLPALYGVVAISYGGRYLRWRLCLGSIGIGRISRADALAWFRGCALTATPAKLGELSRVQLLHDALGYPRVPLVHVFMAERLADLVAVTLLLLLLAPRQLAGRLPSASLPWMLVAAAALGGVAALAWLRRGALGVRVRRWRHHLPSGALGRAMVPVTALTMVIWAVEAMVLWLLVRHLSPVAISVPVAISIYLISGTAGIASSLPGGIGVNEATTVLLLSQQGIPAAVGLPIAILRRLITLWSMVGLAALVGVAARGSSQVERKPRC